MPLEVTHSSDEIGRSKSHGKPFEKQVDAAQYQFSRYVDQLRWASLWHQVAEIVREMPSNVLEVGKGNGLLGAILRHYGIDYQSTDIDPELKPDHVASVTDLPFASEAFDVVGCFQVLEHIPYSDFRAALTELIRVARTKVVISLPDAKALWQYSFYLPMKGELKLNVPRPRLRPQEHVFDGEHYWEINKAGYPLADVMETIGICGARVQSTYRVSQNPYHRFFVLEKHGA